MQNEVHFYHPYGNLISNTYLAKVAEIGLQRIKNADDTLFRLGTRGGEGNEATPHFVIIQKSTGKTLPFNGISMNPWNGPLQDKDTFNDKNLTEIITIQQLLGCNRPESNR